MYVENKEACKMSQDFNELETAVLNWLKRTYAYAPLSAQIDSAKLSKREWTKVGFFVYLDVPKNLEPISLDNLGGYWPLDGPHLKSNDIEFGGDTILWGTDGYIDCIEMFAYGSFFNESVVAFELT